MACIHLIISASVLVAKVNSVPARVTWKEREREREGESNDRVVHTHSQVRNRC